MAGFLGGRGAVVEVGEVHNLEMHVIPLAIEAALGWRPCLENYDIDYLTLPVPPFATSFM